MAKRTDDVAIKSEIDGLSAHRSRGASNHRALWSFGFEAPKFVALLETLQMKSDSVGFNMPLKRGEHMKVETLIATGILLFSFGVVAQTETSSPTEAPVHKYFKGTDTVYRADGQTVIFSDTYYCDRWAVQAAGLMNENAVMVLANGTASSYHVVMSISADGSNFTITNDDKTLTGSGNFVGKPWAWTGMTGKFVQSNGTYVEDSNIISDSLIAGIKKIYSASGVLEGYDVATLTPTTVDDFNSALQKVTPAPTSK